MISGSLTATSRALHPTNWLERRKCLAVILTVGFSPSGYNAHRNLDASKIVSLAAMKGAVFF